MAGTQGGPGYRERLMLLSSGRWHRVRWRASRARAYTTLRLKRGSAAALMSVICGSKEGKLTSHQVYEIAGEADTIIGLEMIPRAIRRLRDGALGRSSTPDHLMPDGHMRLVITR